MLKIFKSLKPKCRHQYTSKRYSAIFPSWTKSMLVQHWGEPARWTTPRYIGFMYQGIHATCDKCGEIESFAEDIDVPVLMPTPEQLKNPITGELPEI